jgi:hypothetical protein
MKLGVSYTIFDGEELLEGSINTIREHVDYISVVYQTVSNFGNESDVNLLPLLKELESKGLIDELHYYKPKVEKGGHYNEIRKRNIGLALSLYNNCTHHMSMDSDEYYDSSEFLKLKNDIIENDYDASFCKMLTYYKSWDYYLDPPEEYYVSLIYKINNSSEYVFGSYCPVLVDPTRVMNNIKHYVIYSRDDIQMHHGSYIRKDIRKKLENSSASVNFKNEIDDIVNYFNNWEYPNKALWGGSPCVYHNIKNRK